MNDGLVVTLDLIGDCPATLLAYVLVELDELRPECVVTSMGPGEPWMIELPAEPPRYSLPAPGNAGLDAYLGEVEARRLVRTEVIDLLRNAEIDVAVAEGELNRLRADLVAARAEIARLEANQRPILRRDPGPGGSGWLVDEFGAGLESSSPHQNTDNASSPERTVSGQENPGEITGGEPCNPGTEPDPQPDLPVEETNSSVEETNSSVEEPVDLMHPETIPGAVRRNSTWYRADGELWECSCGRKTRTIGAMRQHRGGVGGWHHLILPTAPPEPVAAERVVVSLPGPYVCSEPDCGRTFETKQAFGGHRGNSHGRNHAPQPKPEPVRIEPRGLPRAMTVDNLVTQMIDDDDDPAEKWVCERCHPTPPPWTREAGLIAHNERVHPAPKNGAWVPSGLPVPVASNDRSDL